MTLVLLLMRQGRTSGGHGLLEAVPRIYQVTPDIPDRRRATKQNEVRPNPADSLKESQLAARSGPSPERRTSPTPGSKQQASERQPRYVCFDRATRCRYRRKRQRSASWPGPASSWPCTATQLSPGANLHGRSPVSPDDKRCMVGVSHGGHRGGHGGDTSHGGVREEHRDSARDHRGGTGVPPEALQARVGRR